MKTKTMYLKFRDEPLILNNSNTLMLYYFNTLFIYTILFYFHLL